MYDALLIKNYWGWDHKQKRERIFTNSKNKYRHPFSIYFMIKKIVVNGAKENILPINCLNGMEIEVAIKIITGTKEAYSAVGFLGNHICP